MKKCKTVLAVALASSMVFGLVGCGSSDAPAATDAGTENGGRQRLRQRQAQRKLPLRRVLLI